ncbi:hypothetical protein L218DRAFT_949104 [Marasmius fiardii PR-910]|nr:hypothetical protein L218DRAFT_949104 [Marasmius fiardii PR-910]
MRGAVATRVLVIPPRTTSAGDSESSTGSDTPTAGNSPWTSTVTTRIMLNLKPRKRSKFGDCDFIFQRSTAIQNIVGITCGATFLIFLLVGGVLRYRMHLRPSNSQQPTSGARSGRWYPLTPPDEEKVTHRVRSEVIPSSQAIASSYTLPLSIVTEGSQIDVHDDTSVRSYEPSVTMTTSMGTTTTSNQEAGPHFVVVGARTTRQMKIEERIYELQIQLLSLYENSRTQRMVAGRTDLTTARVGTAGQGDGGSEGS